MINLFLCAIYISCIYTCMQSMRMKTIAAGIYFSHKATIAVNIIVAYKVGEKLEALYPCVWSAFMIINFCLFV